VKAGEINITKGYITNDERLPDEFSTGVTPVSPIIHSNVLINREHNICESG
jgi:hypothetical protein